MKKKYKYILAAAILLCGAAASVWYSMAPVFVEAETVKKQDLSRIFSVQAEFLPETFRVLSAGAAGIVEEAPFSAGRAYRSGETLFRTSDAKDTAMRLQMEQVNAALSEAKQEYSRLYGENGLAESEVSVAKTAYDLAEKKYQNGKALADAGGYVAQAELDELKGARDTARERYRQAKEAASQTAKEAAASQLASLESQLALLGETAGAGEIVMPYDGVLWELYVETGTYVTARQPVARVYAPESLTLSASLLTEDAARLSEGDRVRVLYGDGSGGKAEVSFLSKTAEKTVSAIGLEESRTTVLLTPDSLPPDAGAGKQADVFFTVLLSPDALTVPATALVPEGSRDVVYVIQDGKTRAAAVETGERESGRVEILSGLSEGDVIVSDPFEAAIRDGMRVKILE